MDRNSPPYYVEPSAEQSVADTRKLIAYIRSIAADCSAAGPIPRPPSHASHHATALVKPVLTPRFAISCTPELLASLGALAKGDPGLTIQTHIAENDSEIKLTKELFPPEILPPPPDGAPRGHTTYAGVYDAYGLLRANTVLAHAVHLEQEEISLIKARNAGVSHCPTSNFNLRSGVAKVGMLLDRGIKV